MNAKVVRILNLRGDGRHRSDPLTVPPPPYPVTAVAVAGARAEAFHLAAQRSTPTVVIPAAEPQDQPDPGVIPAPVPIAVDYRELRVFPAVIRGACRVGLTGLGTRGPVLVAPLEGWGLDRFTADADKADDLGPEWDQVAERAEAGFYRASRVFHSADTAGFPAVTQ